MASSSGSGGFATEGRRIPGARFAEDVWTYLGQPGLNVNSAVAFLEERPSTLLRKNLENAKASLEFLIADLQFLRNLVSITQVTIAHVYNWDFRRWRAYQAAAKDS